MTGKRRCWKCGKVAELGEMRYDNSGRDLTCPSCLKVEKKGKGTAANRLQPAITASDDKSETMSYQCGSCGLGFSERKGARVRCCPYCGKGNFRVAFRDSAQKLIEDSAKEKFED